MFKLHLGNSLEILKTIPENSVDSVVTDPPYELGFMGRKWDKTGIANDINLWQECLRVLKPGGHLLAFSGSRTYHRMASAIDDAGFDIRDQIMWLYGSGFPKSHDVSKAIDKAAGAKREAIGDNPNHRAKSGVSYEGIYQGGNTGVPLITAPATEDAKKWQGWGTALKPSFEPLCFAKKPFTTDAELDIVNSSLFQLREKICLLSLALSVKANLQSNKADLNAACVIAQWPVENVINTLDDLKEQTDILQLESAINTSSNIVLSWQNTLDALSKLGNTSTIEMKLKTTIDWKILIYCLSQITPSIIIMAMSTQPDAIVFASNAATYFNAELNKLNAILELSAIENVIFRDQENSLDVDDKVRNQPLCLARKPLVGTVVKNVLAHSTGALNIDASRIDGARWPANVLHDGISESWSRFFYCPKASKKDKDEGLESFDVKDFSGGGGTSHEKSDAYGAVKQGRNSHPTVKPTELMRYLCRLVTPPGGIVLDPFMGSGSTGKAAILEGFQFIGIDMMQEYFDIAKARIEQAVQCAE